MAGWIKMRASVIDSPRLIALTRTLAGNRAFLAWLAPGYPGGWAGEVASESALRCVTCSLLMRVWSTAREFGKFVGDDLVLAPMTAADLDQMGGAPGLGISMVAVGWASEDADAQAVTLPNFKQHNVPVTPAERMAAMRDRDAARVTNASRGVTHLLRGARNKCVTEKRREEKNKYPPSIPPAERGEDAKPVADKPTADPPPAIPPELDTDEFRAAWGEWKAERRQRRVKPYTPRGEKAQLGKLAEFGPSVAIAAIRESIRAGWQGLFPEKAKPPPAAAAPARPADPKAAQVRQIVTLFRNGTFSRSDAESDLKAIGVNADVLDA